LELDELDDELVLEGRLLELELDAEEVEVERGAE